MAGLPVDRGAIRAEEAREEAGEAPEVAAGAARTEAADAARIWEAEQRRAPSAMEGRVSFFAENSVTLEECAMAFCLIEMT